MKKKPIFPYQCWYCKEQFKRFVELKHHIIMHQGGEIRRMSYEEEIKSKKDK